MSVPRSTWSDSRPPVRPIPTEQHQLPGRRDNDSSLHLLGLTDGPSSDSHLVILHGWSNTTGDMQRWVDALSSAGVSNGRHVWNVDYPRGSPFPVGAQNVLSQFEQQAQAGYVFRDVVMLGYSMGGLVARQMIAQGFPVTRLATVCSPHQGMMSYVPGIDPGVQSLLQGSPDLAVLNSNPTEAAARGRYLCAAVQYTVSNLAGTWFEDDDQLVDDWSARGDYLGASIGRININLTYDGLGPEIGAPHQEGMNPEYFASVVQFLHG